MSTNTVSFRTGRLIAMLLVLLSSIGCATMEGAGEDIEDAGEAIQEEANQD
ncbi:entericidin A/B family lipoprotein [Bowmanella dokdonensis]|uniref:Entericidin A/B family lipoprotein n=1 Tax=Bowmanella dokdonensis TaxID=751969 RepID=A0A939ISK6_9ALTE|nr:entericidin A/B family lipoprotein [Bowmanella dokdonensis]MBN7826832.1 entericidin A/B family lipoprotein [Bowmanella dokdonensis]